MAFAKVLCHLQAGRRDLAVPGIKYRHCCWCSGVDGGVCLGLHRYAPVRMFYGAGYHAPMLMTLLILTLAAVALLALLGAIAMAGYFGSLAGGQVARLLGQACKGGTGRQRS